MLKQKFIRGLLSFSIVFIGLLLAGIISYLLVESPELNKTESSKNSIQGISTIANTASSSPKPTVAIATKSAVKILSYASPSQALYISTPIPIPSAVQVAAQTPPPSQNPQTYQVNVSINDSSTFTISVSEGANHCDVLNKALTDGKISSLIMRYDTNFGTYAVYQINGIGKENSVWWTYTVNDQSPNQGCSFVKVKNNDNVHWKYIGS